MSKEKIGNYILKQAQEICNSDQIISELEQINSIEFVKLIVNIEDEFNIEFPDEKLVDETFNSLNELISYTETLLKEKDELL